MKKFLTALGIYLSVAGLVTFSLFILEESLQTAMFGSWAAQDAEAWEIVHESCVFMENINGTMTVMNYSAGWVQPFAFVSYRAYSKSAEIYIRALRAKVFARAPELFIGQDVDFNFRPDSIEVVSDDALLLKSGKIAVFVMGNTRKPTYRIVGRMIQTPNGTLLSDTRS
ncbi:MAG: hypothetical protein ABIL58_00940 [Pseudomonadota bacterium]